MTEHAAWRPSGGTGVRRVFTTSAKRHCLVTVETGVANIEPLDHTAPGPPRDTFRVPRGVDAVPELTSKLGSLGLVTRFRTEDLWEAIGTAIIRQVIRAGQARKLYRAFCDTHGQRVELPGGDTFAMFPTPEVVLGLSDDHFRSIGMAFKRRPLQAAADAYLVLGEKWADLPADILAAELQSVPRIGPWTAHAAVADWSNDWSLYPYADLAVRTWAKRAAPGYAWPDDEPSFGQVWRALVGEHLCAMTLLTLAWGSHHGDDR